MNSSIPILCGIYKIVCVSGKIYIGSSNNLRRRWNNHKNKLRNNNHRNCHLQRAWNKYGESAFTFEIVELIMPQILIEREQYWLDTLKPFDEKGFNIAIKADAPTSGRIISDETRSKISRGNLGKKKSPDHIAKSAASRRGLKQSQEGIEKRRAANKGKKRSPEFCERLRQANIGKRASEETRAKQRAAKIGKAPPPLSIERSGAVTRKNCIFTSPDGIEYRVNGLAKFCREHGLGHATMSEVANGKRRQHKGWKCRYDQQTQVTIS